MPRMPSATPRPLWQQDLLVAVLALLALIAWDASGADLWAVRRALRRWHTTA